MKVTKAFKFEVNFFVTELVIRQTRCDLALRSMHRKYLMELWIKINLIF